VKTRVTSFDVAEKAGVSQSTVSKALRNSEGVSAETRERVLDAARALDYRADRRAASLRSGATGRLAVVILTDPHDTYGIVNPFYMALLAHVASAAADRGRDILLSFQRDVTNFFANYRKDGIADGIIVLGTAKNVAGWRYFAEARSRGESIVCWGSPNDSLPTIRCDNQAGAEAAVRHLVAKGRRRIVFLGPGWRRHHAYRDRRAGYLRVMAEHDLPSREAPSVRATAREEEGYVATLKLADEDDSFDAIFAASDALALGALQALHRCGRAIPDDVAVVGFDGVGSAPYTSPSLSTIEQNGGIAGNCLVDTLLLMMAGENYRLLPVPTSLVQRESSAGRAP
jgi:DNA-binding LacI/PurR family transcriptional regulator